MTIGDARAASLRKGAPRIAFLLSSCPAHFFTHSIHFNFGPSSLRLCDSLILIVIFNYSYKAPRSVLWHLSHFLLKNSLKLVFFAIFPFYTHSFHLNLGPSWLRLCDSLILNMISNFSYKETICLMTFSALSAEKFFKTRISRNWPTNNTFNCSYLSRKMSEAPKHSKKPVDDGNFDKEVWEVVFRFIFNSFFTGYLKMARPRPGADQIHAQSPRSRRQC